MKNITVLNIQPKAHRRGGQVYQPTCTDEHNAEIKPGESIRIFGLYKNHIRGPQKYDRTFKVGDMAEYDSWNLKYNGRIVSIGAKCVAIEDGGRVRRLSLCEFCDHNWDFDLAKSEAHNAEEMHHI